MKRILVVAGLLLVAGCARTVTVTAPSRPTYLPAEVAPFHCLTSQSAQYDLGTCAHQRAAYDANPSFWLVCPSGYTLVTTGPESGCWLYPK